ncbi:uncharacterized protein SCHCODRAFT_02597800 [Schizophyllum commune H4-8]|uniref:Uncharacterized protein n=1 Tax=Schizophyllum commune (strain H4-8 / FGSC 9210) TaxID=578458 RepID=D8PXK7_SCHCM|nr:uncharacterized protein SCHCODRAFT_02597800 [Schizophyllum commune H4-8]KAI5896953.1 hypothetical protein SCHCODRAFT_02597800 [Schizophyllum commune H4-8]
MTTAINIADVRIECRESASASKRFIKHVRLTATHPQYGTLGTLEAYKIERVYALKGHFLEYLDAKSAELSDFGEKVLDENLNVYWKLIDHEYHKGTGCWGAELNDGDIVYLHSVEVGVEARSRAECRVLNPPIINFFRKLGFRRIGRTTYFAYSPDADHPSRSLAAFEDLNIDPYKYAQRTTGAIQDQEAAALKQAYPLHTLLDPPFSMTDLVRGLHPGSEPRTPPPTKEDVAAAIEAAYTRDPASIHARDERGFTPLYIAATKGHGLALEKLFDLADCREDILSRDNVEDQNAIEAHLEAMRLSNKMMAVLGPAPLGFSDGGLSMNHALRKKAGEDVGTLEDFMARQRYDCSCGQCRGGWLSARMAAALVAEAKMNFAVGTDMAYDSFSRRRRDSFGLDSELDLPGVEFIPSLLRQRLNRTFYQGFLGVHRAIASLIERGVLPTPDAVINEAIHNRTDGYDPFDVQMYLASGGTAEFAINYLVSATKDQMLDDSLLEMVEESADWDALPRCTNDWQFALAGRMMGLVSTQQWGPYGEGEGGLFEDEFGGKTSDSSNEGEVEEDVEMGGAGQAASYGVDMAAAAGLYDVEAILSSLRR